MQELVEQLLSYLRTAWPYRWPAVVVAWIIASAGWTAVYLMPDRYEARARVFVDTQSMLRPLLTGLVAQPNLDQMVVMMGRTLVSRLNVEKVIQMAGIDVGLDNPERREQLIARLTEGLTINSAGRENLYTITYADQNPERAKLVVQSLLTIFMEGSVGDKRRDSDSARQFIEEQLNSYSEKLATAENAIKEFKRQHQGFMPGDGRDFYARLSDAKAALARVTLELEEALQTRDTLRSQLTGDAETTTQPGGMGAAVPPLSDIDTRIRALEQRLDSLRLTYTEQHPDVVATVRTIAQLKEEKLAQGRIERSAPGARQSPTNERSTVALATAEGQVAAIKARVAAYGKRYNDLQAAANALPQAETEYKQLTRDYDVIKARYDLLLERRESAQISRDVEASDVGMGFRVIDPPQVPSAPSAPNRPRLISLVLLAALGGGLGFALLMSQIKTTFNDERRLREVSGLPVLGTIAMAWTAKLTRRRRLGLLALLLSILSLFSAYVAVMASLVVAVSRA